MGRTNHRPDLNGLLILDKPLTATSARCCGIMRKRSSGGKVGHAGTLDPLATGVLVLCLGKATKLSERVMGTGKAYRAAVDLSARSASDDLETEPEPVDVAPHDRPTRQGIESLLEREFTGVIQQAPPTFSAVHIDGKRAYTLARAGKAPEMERRPVRIDAVTVAEYRWPLLELDIACGKGTYIRSLARDIGLALRTGGMLTALRRTRVGPFTAEQAFTMNAVPRLEAEHLIPFEASVELLDAWDERQAEQP